LERSRRGFEPEQSESERKKETGKGEKGPSLGKIK
jgi:hypothetical protein